jgi:ribosomal protein S18 acetylase RimI-like enzyme
MEGRLEASDAAYIEERVGETWSFPVVTMVRMYDNTDGLEGLVWREERGEIAGLVTWFIEGDRAEIVTLDAYKQGRHIGGRLLDGAEAVLRERGARRVSITTTNDNVRAIAFYLRRGYRIVRVEVDGMERVRALKPGVPLEGNDGLLLRDMLEFEKTL